MDRRRFLIGAGAVCGWGGAVGWSSLVAGCSPPDDAALDVRLRARLRELSLDSDGVRSIAAASKMTPASAIESLRRDVSRSKLYALTSSRLLLAEFIEARSLADLRAGRTQRVRGWWVAETEVAVAVLVAA